MIKQQRKKYTRNIEIPNKQLYLHNMDHKGSLFLKPNPT